ncbi:MAG: sulfatase [Pirellulaceae bacterium]|nr:sulfatase [Pirellulaceae bacterium]
MKNRIVLTLVGGLWLSIANFSVSLAADQPNIILILIDDLGWKDLGCYGNEFVETPRIDQLALEGIRFTDFYASGAVCSPTRCALQSGQNQARIGITAHIPGHWRPFERVITPQTTMALPLDIVTVAEALKTVNYTTGYVGKWHLDTGRNFWPDKQGYDYSRVIGGPHLPGNYRVSSHPEIKPKPGQFRTDFEADLCIEFIQQNKTRPFFLMVSPFAVHIPLAAMSDKVEKYRIKSEQTGQKLPHPVYAALVEHCDDLVGRILDEVQAQGLAENSMIVFSSDNGGLYRRYDYRAHADDTVATQEPLKGEKGALHEGGIRVPLIIKYPPLTQAGTVSSEPTISHDFYPTFVELAGGQLPEHQTIDGYSLLPLLTQPAVKLPRSALYWHYPHYHHDRPASSIREREWKLIEYLDGTGDKELYHLAQDLGETTNLVSEKPGRVMDLTHKLQRWRQQVAARIPIHNPGYDPARAHEWWNLRSGKPVASDRRQRFPSTEKER